MRKNMLSLWEKCQDHTSYFTGQKWKSHDRTFHVTYYAVKGITIPPIHPFIKLLNISWGCRLVQSQQFDKVNKVEVTLNTLNLQGCKPQNTHSAGAKQDETAAVTLNSVTW